jgi:hypothetical protein
LYFVCCKILGVKPGSDLETIKAAYRKSAKELHPDVNSSERAHEYFVILQNAYQYLSEHPYTPEEVMLLRRSAALKDLIKNRNAPGNKNQTCNSAIERYSLSEVLKNSLTARMLFIVFHVLFLIAGIYLIIRSIYDALFFIPQDRNHFVSAYFTIGFGFLFGIVITIIFLYTGITFIRER